MRARIEERTEPAARTCFAKAAVLAAGLSILPSCAGAYVQIPLAPAAAQAPRDPDKANQDPRTACVAVPERRLVDVPGPHGRIRYVTETMAVEAGDYALSEDLGQGRLKVVKVNDESVGLSFVGNRNSVWLVQYGQESQVGEPAGMIRARADLCLENFAKLTITYRSGPSG